MNIHAKLTYLGLTYYAVSVGGSVTENNVVEIQSKTWAKKNIPQVKTTLQQWLLSFRQPGSSPPPQKIPNSVSA